MNTVDQGVYIAASKNLSQLNKRMLAIKLLSEMSATDRDTVNDRVLALDEMELNKRTVAARAVS